MAMERIPVSYRLDARIVRRMRAYVETRGGSMTALVERAVVRYMDDGERERAYHTVEVTMRALGPDRVRQVLEDALVENGMGGDIRDETF